MGVPTMILIADYQVLTDHDAFDKISQNTKQLVIDYLAAGLDPEKCTLYIQSMIPELAELTTYLMNIVSVSRVQRNPTVKTEIAQKRDLFGESVTYGFLGYPVSQAADITAFKGEIVPAGEDQEPLIEQCREIVRKFNSIYGEVLVEPEAVLSSEKRIKGLDGNDKMGKSLGNAIYLSDSEDEITKKVKDYSKNRNDLNTYYNVGKLLSEAGKHYGEGIIKEYSKRLLYLILTLSTKTFTPLKSPIPSTLNEISR